MGHSIVVTDTPGNILMMLIIDGPACKVIMPNSLVLGDAVTANMTLIVSQDEDCHC